MTITFNRDAYNKVFNDLDKFRDYCRFEGKVFNEADLYKKDSPIWQSYIKHQIIFVLSHVTQAEVLTIGETNDNLHCRYRSS